MLPLPRPSFSDEKNTKTTYIYIYIHNFFKKTIEKVNKSKEQSKQVLPFKEAVSLQKNRAFL
jgi:hypothetical protein